jgi:demethylmenaquinone methyltransferase/2-methoxy-6-polyprenyl-1,4-benzoquinol methylase
MLTKEPHHSIDHEKRDAETVGKMFSSIATRYDLLNHVLSFGLDYGWRRRAAMETKRADCQSLLDVCTGTGDMAIELCRVWNGNAMIEGIDLSKELLNIGKEKARRAGLDNRITFREGNAEQLLYRDEQFDAVTITFGLRNIQDRSKALKEFYRVTKSGGCFVCLEFSQPTNSFFKKLYSFYLLKLVPIISLFLGSDPGAYRYLGSTIQDFPAPNALATLIDSAGWRNIVHCKLGGGIVAIHTAEKL